jgi:hypothetical protein
VLSLAAANRAEIVLGDVLRAFITVILFSGILSWIISRLAKHTLRAQLVLSFAGIIYFSYGHVYNVIRGISLGTFTFGRHRFLLPSSLLLIILFYILLRRISIDEIRWTQVVNVIGSILIAFPLLTLTRFELISKLHKKVPVSQIEIPLQVPENPKPPDIYYIILDSYARQDILKDLYEFDNRDFIEALEGLGFYVANKSSANHSSTLFSLTSSLNLDYVQNLDIELPASNNPQPLIEHLKDNRVTASLRAIGYTIVATASGTFTTSMPDADIFLTPDTLEADVRTQQTNLVINPFEEMYIRTTILRVPLDLILQRQTSLAAEWIEDRIGASRHRKLVLSAFEHLDNMDTIPGPKFVFVHIISPHRPYLFSASGEEVVQADSFTFEDTTPSEAVSDEFAQYRDQLLFINQKILATLTHILSTSDPEPVIMLQADHGPAFGFDWQNPDEKNLATKFPILNAYSLPEHCQEDLYESISPVNSFRVVFNCLFNANLDLLEDRSYFTNHHDKEGFEFIPIELLLESTNVG